MALGVCVLFDRQTDRALRALWRQLEERGTRTLESHTHRRHVPHMSYVVMLSCDLAAVGEAVAALPDNGPFALVFDAVGTFRRGRVCLVPAVPADLVARQQAVVEAVSRTGAVVHRHYQADRWIPHCSVAPRARLDQLPAVAAGLFDVLPLNARAVSSALIESATGQRWPLPNLP